MEYSRHKERKTRDFLTDLRYQQIQDRRIDRAAGKNALPKKEEEGEEEEVSGGYDVYERDMSISSSDFVRTSLSSSYVPCGNR